METRSWKGYLRSKSEAVYVLVLGVWTLFYGIYASIEMV